MVKHFLDPYPGEGVLGVSGGADSVALVRAVVAAGRSVTAVHVHHGLRGREADVDAAFVESLCRQLGIRYECQRVELSGRGSGLEAAGRQARYRIFATVAQQRQARWVAVAHTADDQAETILHRLIRGTGLSGLRGMAPVRPLPLPSGEVTIPLLRPLLTLRRQQLRDYLQSLQQPFREDASNQDLRFTRNRLRHQLLPLLESFNSRFVEALQRLSHQVTEAEELLEKLGQALLHQAEKPRAGPKVILDADVLQTAEPLVRRYALRCLWQREGWPQADMDYNAWCIAAQMCCRTKGAWNFPGGVRLHRRGRVVQLWRQV
ncbi:MAG: tRNA lysidine(34) synthetase TilS [Gemmataceae bacterium]|nr:tRNA lysidine(34) synthetase TilS [Gemmataceae bacterium]MDW8244314.1 tRNA lysidine(34) synthetase TilS [Thermogemmata sp.]